MSHFNTAKPWFLCFLLMFSTVFTGAVVPDSQGQQDKSNLVIPFVMVLSPTQGEIFPSGAIISFNGSATDRDLMDITHTLTWNSDIDGLIGTEGSFVTILNDGEHTISARATDSLGNEETVKIKIQVGENKHK